MAAVKKTGERTDKMLFTLTKSGNSWMITDSDYLSEDQETEE
jgi:hypothetical protein